MSNNPFAETPLPSPCIGICQIEADSGLCVGCLRSRREIARWGAADNEERLDMLQDLKKRRIERGQRSTSDMRPRRRTNRRPSYETPKP